MRQAFICGNDPKTMLSWAVALREASFVIRMFEGMESIAELETAEFPDLIILCTSLSNAERQIVRSAIGDLVGGVPTITLIEPSESPNGTGHFLSIAEGRQGLVKLSQELTDRADLDA